MTLDRTAHRVAIVQGQTRPTLLAAVAFVVAAPIAAVVPHRTGTWLPLHLLLVGGLTSAISGATQLLAVTWSAAPAPDPRLVAAQRWCVVAGAVAVAGGRAVDIDAVTGGGAALVAVGLGLLAVILVGIRRQSSLDRFHPAIEAYVVAIGFGLAGVAMGAAIAAVTPGDWWAGVRGAHVIVNVFGLVGIVVAGTLPSFVATQARMQTAGRATPGRLRAPVAVLGVTTALAALAQLLGRPGLAGVALLGYAGGLVGLATVLPRPGPKQLAWAGPRLLQLAAGSAWWAAMVVALAAVWLTDGTGEARVLRVLVVGGFAQVLVASLAYFGPVLRGGGYERLTDGFATTASWPGLALANAAAVALLVDVGPVAVAAAAAWALDTGWRTLRLLASG